MTDGVRLLRLNFPEPVLPAASRLPVSHPVYGRCFVEWPLTVGEPTPWVDPLYGWQLHLHSVENDGRTLVLEPVQGPRP